MLEKLDSIPWSELQHAYGNASDVPRLMRSLFSLEKEVRAKARDELFNNINHQGSCYQATLYAIPFVFELIQNSDVADRHLLIYHLVCIAVGLDSDYQPYEFGLAEFRRLFEGKAAKLSDKQQSKFVSGPHIELACYESVNAKTNVFVSLLSDDLEEVRVASAYALCWFPECPDALPLIKNKLEQLEGSQARELANFALSYGFLCDRSGVPVEIDLLSPLLEHGRLYVRVAAAIALAKTTATTRVLDVLFEGVQAEEIGNIYETTPFNDGDLQSYAEAVLDQVSSA